MMKLWLYVLLVLPSVYGVKVFPALDNIRPSASLETQAQAAEALIGRVLGARANHFKVMLNMKYDHLNRDTFNLVSDGNNVTISATSGVAATMGFYYYLKTYCGCLFTWGGEQLNLPNPLPKIDTPGDTVTANDRFRYYQNVCTVSYSFAFWDWSRWERHIDWMAMNGFNLPLAFTGQEAIWQRVYMKMGMTKEELQHHFGGPAFLAWARMGNMKGWGGPLPQSWLDGQLAMQHKILARMRELGMTPVLPGFAGHVPDAILRLYPKVNVTKMHDWGYFNNTFCCVYLLDFEEPLFHEIGRRFLQEYMKEFGTNHVYNVDTFNEMNPKSKSTKYLKKAGSVVFKAMTDADPNAIWLMQGWLFRSSYWKLEQVKAYVTSVPQGRMLILDLSSDIAPVFAKNHMFFGQPFIWNMLHNFGGTMELYGAIDVINKDPFVARAMNGSTMVGTGLTPEGIFQNEVMYEFMSENAVAKGPRNLTKWFSYWATNRYGKYNSDADLAWQILKRTAYNCTDGHLNGNWVGDLPNSLPSLKLKSDSSVYNNTDRLSDHSRFVIPTWRPSIKIHTPDVWYNPTELYKAWGLMVDASSKLGNNTLFRYDLVDVGRNSLQTLSIKFYIEMVTAYKMNNTDLLQMAGESLLRLLDDMEALLGTDIHFLLGTWIRDARKWGTNPQEANLMEYNARNQITLWGPRGNVRDYAAKQWSGLMSSYYRPRWNHFYKTLLLCVKDGRKFNQNSFTEVVFELIEKPFTFGTNTFPVTPSGDSLMLSDKLYKFYIPLMKSEFFQHLQEWVGKGRRHFIKSSTRWVQDKWDSEYLWHQRSSML